MATNDVLDRLEALLAAATQPFPATSKGWEGLRKRRVTRYSGEAIEVAGEVGGQLRRIADFAEPRDADAYIALRNAAPALIRLARAALAMYGSAESGDATEAEVAVIGKQIEDGMKALGEVRL